MIKNLMKRLGRYRVIMDRQDNEPYLERYYVFLKDRKQFPFNIFIHKFLKGDPDEPHDHPWSYFTLILWGGYYEYVPYFNESGKLVNELKRWRGPGHFRFCQPESYHRIELKPGVTAWTMFIPGRQQRNWGFWVDDQWIPQEQYLEKTKEKSNA